MESSLWMGTDTSFHAYVRDVQAAIDKYGSLNAMPHLVKMSGQYDEEGDYNPVGIRTEGAVAILDIEGPTVTKSSFFSQVFGIVAYDDIQNRFMEAHDDPAIKAVLMNIDSGGGNAEGVFKLGRFINEFNASVMPVISYDANRQCSAALLYGSGAGQMIADQDSEIGSIGCIAVQKEFTKMLEMAGIKATVFRSAEFKALGQPYEKLSDTAKAQIQEDVMRVHRQFVNTLVENTGNDLKVVNSWANGKVFEASQALKMGLLDSVQPIERVVATLNKRLENAPRKGSR